MAQFTVTSVGYGAAITSARVNSIISRAKASFNRLDTTNFPSACVPMAALQTRNSIFYVTLAEHGTVSATVAVTTRSATATGYFPVPASLSVVSAAVIVGSITGGSSVTVQVRKGSTTVVASAAVTAAKTYKAMTINTAANATAIGSGVLVELRYGATGGRTITNVVVVLKCKKNLST